MPMWHQHQRSLASIGDYADGSRADGHSRASQVADIAVADVKRLAAPDLLTTQA